MSDGAVARALVLEAPRHLVVREFRVPAVGDDDALVRVVACGLCGTDHEQYTGELAGGFTLFPAMRRSGRLVPSGPGAHSAGVWPKATG
jgi:alcohol dehydrogenase